MILYVWYWIRQDHNTNLVLLGHLVNCRKQSKYTLLPFVGLSNNKYYKLENSWARDHTCDDEIRNQRADKEGKNCNTSNNCHTGSKCGHHKILKTRKHEVRLFLKLDCFWNVIYPVSRTRLSSKVHNYLKHKNDYNMAVSVGILMLKEVKCQPSWLAERKNQLWCKYLNNSDEQVRNVHLIWLGSVLVGSPD